ncbi:MAG: hypothetical protein FWC41_01730 [Firmicutes bacterium]|nr:hypothetical protein [Bacillota bacterium]
MNGKIKKLFSSILAKAKNILLVVLGFFLLIPSIGISRRIRKFLSNFFKKSILEPLVSLKKIGISKRIRDIFSEIFGKPKVFLVVALTLFSFISVPLIINNSSVVTKAEEGVNIPLVRIENPLLAKEKGWQKKSENEWYTDALSYKSGKVANDTLVGFFYAPKDSKFRFDYKFTTLKKDCLDCSVWSNKGKVYEFRHLHANPTTWTEKIGDIKEEGWHMVVFTARKIANESSTNSTEYMTIKDIQIRKSDKINSRQLPSFVFCDNEGIKKFSSSGSNAIAIVNFGEKTHWYIAGSEDKNSITLSGVYGVSNEDRAFTKKEDRYYNNLTQEDLLQKGINYRNVSEKYKLGPGSYIGRNNYGLSYAREFLNGNFIQKNIPEGKQSKMIRSTIDNVDTVWDTHDPNEFRYFKVSDFIYLARTKINGNLDYANPVENGEVNSIYIGENDNLNVDTKLYPSFSYFRSPRHALQIAANENVRNEEVLMNAIMAGIIVINTKDISPSGIPYTLTPAAKIDVSSLLFASSAPDNMEVENNKFVKLEDPLMKLRYVSPEGTDLSKTSIKTDGTNIVYENAPSNSVIKIIGVSPEGKVMFFSKKILEKDGNLDISKIDNYSELSDIKIWIEESGTGKNKGLNFATFGSTPNPPVPDPEPLAFDQMSNGVRVTAGKGVFPEGSKLEVQTVKKGDEAFEFLIEHLDSPDKVKKLSAYIIKVLDKDGKAIEKFSSAEVWLPIPNDMKHENLKVAYVKIGPDKIFKGQIKEYKGNSYYVFETTHFSPYALLDQIKFPITGEQDSILFYNIAFKTGTALLIYFCAKKRRFIA